MFENQVLSQTVRQPKARVAVPNAQFPFANALEIEEEGQLAARVIVESISLEPDEDGNDRRNIRFKIIDAKRMDTKSTQII